MPNENSNTPPPGQQPQTIPLSKIHDLPGVYHLKPPKGGANPRLRRQKASQLLQVGHLVAHQTPTC